MGEAFMAANPTADLTVMGLADAGGAVAATGTQAIAGTATGSGVLALGIGPWRIPTIVASGAAAATVATAVRAAVNAATYLPVTASGSAGNVILTAKHAGAVGNDIRIRLNPAFGDITPAGITVTIAPMTTGAGVPDIDTALAAVAAEWFTDIAVAWSDATTLGKLEASLATRYAAMGRRDAHGYAAMPGTFGTLTAAGANRNSPHLTIIGAKDAGSMPWQWAASLAAVACFYLTNDPARQLRTLPLPGIVGPDGPDRFTPSEQDLLLRDGISTFDVGPDGTVTLQRVISTYQVSALGVADVAWLDITTLADDGSPAAEFSDAVVTPRILHSSWGARCMLYERLGWIEDARRTVAESVFVRDGSDRNRVNANQKVRVVGNLMVFAANLQFEV
jgi:phage tail sheath gpL-like